MSVVSFCYFVGVAIDSRHHPMASHHERADMRLPHPSASLQHGAPDSLAATSVPHI